MTDKYPVYELYDFRTNFVLIALTGITDSGCTKFAEHLEKPFDKWDKMQLRDDCELRRMAYSNDKNDVVLPVSSKCVGMFAVCSNLSRRL